MSNGKLTDVELADIRQRMEDVLAGPAARAALEDLFAHIDGQAAELRALQAHVTAPEKMLGEARRLLLDAMPPRELNAAENIDWRDRRADWLTRFDATHSGTPTALDATETREVRRICSGLREYLHYAFCPETGKPGCSVCGGCGKVNIEYRPRYREEQVGCSACGTPASNAGTGTP